MTQNRKYFTTRKKVGNQKFLKQAACYLSCLFISFCVNNSFLAPKSAIYFYYLLLCLQIIFSASGFILPKFKMFWLFLILYTSHRLFGDLNHNPVAWSLKGIKNAPKLAFDWSKPWSIVWSKIKTQTFALCFWGGQECVCNQSKYAYALWALWLQTLGVLALIFAGYVPLASQCP